MKTLDKIDMFALLVKGEDDILGQVAYALYKEQKRQYFESLGRVASEEEVKNFILASSTEQSLSFYRERAYKNVGTLFDDLFSSELDDMEVQCNNRHIELIKEAIKPIKPKGFWYQVGIGVVTTTIISVLCGLAFLGLIFSKGGLEQVLTEVLSR